MAEQNFEQQKQQAADAAATMIHDGTQLGLGSGSTVFLIVAALGKRRQAGDLNDLVVVAASSRTEAALEQAGIPISTLDDYPQLDLSIDGADEVDPGLAMIKGGGGAMLRERLVLAAAKERLIIVDTSKIVPVLGNTLGGARRSYALWLARRRTRADRARCEAHDAPCRGATVHQR